MSGLRILSWNVNGLRAAHRKGFLPWFASENPDILCLQETKISEDQLSANLRQVEGYDSYFACAERKGYSGVAIYTKVPPVQVESSFNVDALANEGRVLLADYGQFVLLNVYFPNGRSSAERLTYKMDFYGAFLEFTDKMVQEGRNVVICGDVNTAHKEIDLARPKANEKNLRLSARGAGLDRPASGSRVRRHFPDVQSRTGAIYLLGPDEAGPGNET